MRHAGPAGAACVTGFMTSRAARMASMAQQQHGDARVRRRALFCSAIPLAARASPGAEYCRAPGPAATTPLPSISLCLTRVLLLLLFQADGAADVEKMLKEMKSGLVPLTAIAATPRKESVDPKFTFDAAHAAAPLSGPRANPYSTVPLQKVSLASRPPPAFAGLCDGPGSGAATQCACR